MNNPLADRAPLGHHRQMTCQGRPVRSRRSGPGPPRGRRGRVQALLGPTRGACARPRSGKRTQLYAGLQHDSMFDTHRFLSINRDISKIHKATLLNKFEKISSAKKGLQ